MQSVVAAAGTVAVMPRTRKQDVATAKSLVLTKGDTPHIRERSNGIRNIPIWIHEAGYQ
jgi:hypothetical protein